MANPVFNSDSSRTVMLGKRPLRSVVEDAGPQDDGNPTKIDWQVLERTTSFLLGQVGQHVNMYDIAARVCVSVKCFPEYLVKRVSRECLNDITTQAVEGGAIAEGVLKAALSSQEPVSPELAYDFYAKAIKDDKEKKRENAFWKAVEDQKHHVAAGEQRHIGRDIKNFIKGFKLSTNQQKVLTKLQKSLKDGTFNSNKDALIALFDGAKDSKGNSFMQNAVKAVWCLHLIEILLDFGIELQNPYLPRMSASDPLRENQKSEIMIARNREDYFLAAKLLLAYNYQQLKKDIATSDRDDPFPGKVFYGRHYESSGSIECARKAFFDNLMQDFLKVGGAHYTHGVLVITSAYDNNKLHIVHWPGEVLPNDCLSSSYNESVGNIVSSAQNLWLQKIEDEPLTRRALHPKCEKQKAAKPSTWTQRVFWGAIRGVLTGGAACQAVYDPSTVAAGTAISALSGSLYSDDCQTDSAEKAIQLVIGGSVFLCGWGPYPAMGAMAASGLSMDFLRLGFRDKVGDNSAFQFAGSMATPIKMASFVNTSLMLLPVDSVCRYLHAATGMGLSLATFVQQFKSSSTFRKSVFALAGLGIASCAVMIATGYPVGDYALTAGRLVTSNSGIWIMNNTAGFLCSKYCLGKRGPRDGENEEHNQRPSTKRMRLRMPATSDDGSGPSSSSGSSSSGGPGSSSGSRPVASADRMRHDLNSTPDDDD